MNGHGGDLNAHLNNRRKDLGLRWRDIADSAGVSEETIRLMRRDDGGRGERATTTEARIEDAVGWTRGSIARIRSGGEPKLQAPVVRISQISAETKPESDVDEELERAKVDASRHGVNPDEWDFEEPLERDMFLDSRFPWSSKSLMHAWLCAAIEEVNAEGARAAPDAEGRDASPTQEHSEAAANDQL